VRTTLSAEYLQSEPAFVQGAADNAAGDGDGGEPANVVERGDAARCDDRQPRRGDHFRHRLRVDALQHTIAADVGVHDRGQVQMLESLGEIERADIETSSQPCVATRPPLASMPSTIFPGICRTSPRATPAIAALSCR